MPYDDNQGKLVDPKVSDVIKALQDQLEIYGDTPLRFTIDGRETEKEIQLDFYKNVLLLHLEEV